MRPDPNERGLTLTEVMIVMVLASLVMLGIVGFYISSQATWIDASTQTLAQRDATVLVDAITEQAHQAYSAEVLDHPDASHQEVILRSKDTSEIYRFWWDPSDQRVHAGPSSSPADDRGAVAGTEVDRFELATSVDSTVLEIRLIQLKGAGNQMVKVTSSVGLLNHVSG